jgi:hypothetical protein
VKKGPEELTFIAFVALESARRPVPWECRFVLRDAGGALLDWKKIDHTAGAFNGCDMPDNRKDAAGFSLLADCVGPGPGPLPVETRAQLTYSINRSHIDLDVKTVGR